ncbi:iron complex transport system ATP-binding protein [Halopseudomonas xinjiangensis]|uniref:Iron complex transport system ATP-binding protein n=1 Tax=Halopseudomonas xinjiangensis TaxID=487184 RepID=A0A1H1W4E1_9GAMM|nr:heme ABC transporter ATP-binding protein [Halopseudomonas xinjiangensis]SDS91953.1 iron complex transport system ATP-binding protein [Halopseudomonas xinjiangensis]
MIEVVALTVLRSGRQVLSNVSFSLRAGEVLAVLGGNGSGKSSLLATLAGDIRPASGELRLDDQALGRVPPAVRACRLAMLPQASTLAFSFRAREVVALGRLPHRSGAAVDREIVAAAMVQADALHLAERNYLHLSGGEQQRIHLARVLAQIWDAPQPCLLMDEPTAALDIAHQHLTLEAARRVAQRGGVALVALHDLNLAARYADQVLLLDQGRVAALGTPWEVLQADRIRDVYGVRVQVQTHPTLDCPLIIT